MFAVDVEVEADIAHRQRNLVPCVISQVDGEYFGKDGLLLSVLEAQFLSPATALDLQNPVQ